MSEIPYYFETPVPKYFRETGWFENEHMFKFVTWAFSRCSTRSHKIVIHGRELNIQPFEFIAGRLTSAKECFLTENIFRNQLISLQEAGLLKKTTNSLTNKYTAYIWVTERFCINDNQQNNQQATNRQPTGNHNQDIKNDRKDDGDERGRDPEIFQKFNLQKGYVMPVIKKTDKDGFDLNCDQAEYFRYAVNKNKPWTTEEIFAAWEVLIEYPSRITNWYRLMDTIIENARKPKPKTTKKQEIKPCKITPLKTLSNEDKQKFLADAMKTPLLAEYDSRKVSKKK